MKKTNGRSRTVPHKHDVIGTNPKKQTPERSTQHSKQPTHEHGMMHNQERCMSGFNETWHGKMHKQHYKLSGAQYATSSILTEHHMPYLSSLSFMYSTRLNVVSMARGDAK